MRPLLSTTVSLACCAALVAIALLGALSARAGDAETAAGGRRVYLPLVQGPGRPATPTPPPAGRLPTALAGTWFSGQLLNLNAYNRQTNTWTSAGGLGHTIALAADGAYTRVSHLEIGGGTTCKSTVDVYHVGSARAEGGRLLLTPGYARTRTVTCGATVSDTEGPYGTVTLPWRTGEDAGRRTRLWLAEPHGETEYYKDGLGPQVVGSWATGDGGAIELYDPATGIWAGPTGASSVWYAFGADGRYRHGRVEAGFDGDPCRTITMTYESGTIAGSGSQLVLTPTHVLRRSVSLCDPSEFADQSLAPGAEERWGWSFAADGTTLSLIRFTGRFLDLTLTAAE
ncbi:MAG TPA: hypothetical protein PKD53_31395 [Chloroflexaceae bacterium]|nr:hypothetical protein [Chloroflexaceae bacterium]